MAANERTSILAHRGGRGRWPENTMVAFRRAADVGAAGVEFDVHLSRDGVPVVIHDATLDRTTSGSGAVASLDFVDLRTLDAGSWFDERFAGERIPTFDEVLEWAAGSGLQLHVELKDGPAADERLTQAVVSRLQAAGMADRAIISSFNHSSVVRAKSYLPELEVTVLYEFGLHRPWEYARVLGANSLCCHWREATPELVRAAADHGVEVRAFDVHDVATMRRVIDAGCAGLFTPYPDLGLELLADDASRR